MALENAQREVVPVSVEMVILAASLFIGLICGFIAAGGRKGFEIPAIICALIASAAICAWADINKTVSGVYDYYVNGVKVSSGAVTAMQDMVLFFILGAGIYAGLFRGLPALFRLNNPARRAAGPRRKKTALLLSIFLGGIGLEMLYLRQSGLWLLRLILIVAANAFTAYFLRPASYSLAGQIVTGSILVLLTFGWQLVNVVRIATKKF